MLELNSLDNFPSAAKRYAHQASSVGTPVGTQQLQHQAADVSAPSEDHIVMIVDDDQHLRETLQDLLAASNLRGVAFGSVAEYVAYQEPDVPACLILDVDLPDGNGLDLLQQMGNENSPAIIAVASHVDIRSCVRAIKGGALDFLTKPLIHEQLLTLVHAALAQDRERRDNQAGLNQLRELYGSLTPREREVLPLVVSGLLNKQAAAHLGIGEVTVRVHRGNIMRKMQAKSLAELVRIAGCLGILSPSRRYSKSGPTRASAFAV